MNRFGDLTGSCEYWDLAHALMVGRQVRGIIAYRRRAIARILGVEGVRFTETGNCSPVERVALEILFFLFLALTAHDDDNYQDHCENSADDLDRGLTHERLFSYDG